MVYRVFAATERCGVDRCTLGDVRRSNVPRLQGPKVQYLDSVCHFDWYEKEALIHVLPFPPEVFEDQTSKGVNRKRESTQNAVK